LVDLVGSLVGLVGSLVHFLVNSSDGPSFGSSVAWLFL
jgi:hypothetical protein